MASIYLLIPLSLMLFVIGIWAVRYAVKSNQFEDLDNESQRIILDDRQERRQVLNSSSVDATNTKQATSNIEKHSKISGTTPPGSDNEAGDGE